MGFLMYHYQKNIGDYRSATMHLSLLEHGIYNQLLDWYYLDENPLTTDNRTLFRRLSARTEEEQQAVIDVLSEMFVQSDSGWTHKRVEREVAQYRSKAERAREVGKLGGRPPKKGIGSENNRDGFQKEPDEKPTANREPITKNQEPYKEESANASSAGVSQIHRKREMQSLFDKFWSAYPRKVAKENAMKAFAKRKPDEQMLGEMLKAVAVQAASDGWHKDGGQFIPHAATWLNAGRWQDEVGGASTVSNIFAGAI